MFNTEDIFDVSGHELMRRRGKVMTRECLRRMRGLRPPEAFAVMMEAFDLDEPMEDLFAESQTIFNSHLDEHLAAMPGLFELLEAIEGRGLPKGVATSSPRSYLEAMLARFDLNSRFDVLLGAEDVTQGKPHPEIYLKAAEQLGVAPAEMLVLEDSQAGIRSAAAAGAVAVAVPCEEAGPHDFDAAHRIVGSLDDLYVLQLVGE